MQAETHELKLTGTIEPSIVPTAFLTYKEFAYESRLSLSSVRKRVRQGDLQAVRIGRSVRIPRSELARLVRQAGVNAPKAVDEAMDARYPDRPVAADGRLA